MRLDLIQCLSSADIPHEEELFRNSPNLSLLCHSTHVFSPFKYSVDIYLISAFSELVHVVRVSRHFGHQFVSNTGGVGGGGK